MRRRWWVTSLAQFPGLASSSLSGLTHPTAARAGYAHPDRKRLPVRDVLVGYVPARFSGASVFIIIGTNPPYGCAVLPLRKHLPHPPGGERGFSPQHSVLITRHWSDHGGTKVLSLIPGCATMGRCGDSVLSTQHSVLSNAARLYQPPPICQAQPPLSLSP